ncbi:MAG: hypothetical protein BWY28_02738 [bacterium ADurb.Bin236]|nr:MAG: hypothetical protein BWY28_02738 [bacterium ADurb.Bin236]
MVPADCVTVYTNVPFAEDARHAWNEHAPPTIEGWDSVNSDIFSELSEFRTNDRSVPEVVTYASELGAAAMFSTSR